MKEPETYRETQLLAALRVLINTTATLEWLKENDPRALKQAEAASSLYPDNTWRDIEDFHHHTGA